MGNLYSQGLFYFYDMNIVLFDDLRYRNQLLPFSYNRPIAEFRVGILKISEKWHHYFPEATVSFLTTSHLQKKYPHVKETDTIFINSAVLPTPALVDAVKRLTTGKGISTKGELIGFRGGAAFIENVNPLTFPAHSTIKIEETVSIIRRPWDIFLQNRQEIIADFSLLTSGKISAPINDPFTQVYKPENVFLEEGASVKASIINAEDGPVYIGKYATISEGSFIKGPFALCDHAIVNPGAKIRGDTTIGPYSKVGGEISNSVIFGYSNKGHDGFLGNSVLGEWCNLGANTNVSNLKNNYSKVKVWDYDSKDLINTEQQFCGLLMGDHSKAGINTMFNTGTIIGMNVNVFGAGFPPKFVPSFSWGGANGFVPFKIDKAIDIANAVMGRRNVPFTAEDVKIFEHIEKESEQFKKEIQPCDSKTYQA